MSRYNNSKGSKNSQYSSNPGLTEKLRPLCKTFFSSSVNSYKEKLKITLSGLWLSLKIFKRFFKRISYKSLRDFAIFVFVYCHGVKWTYH